MRWSPAADIRSSRAWTTRRATGLGQTLDDAAGEAFDKGARLLGSAIRAGRRVDRLAGEGDPEAFHFPRSSPGELDFCFSGLKTSLLYVAAPVAGRGAGPAQGGPRGLLPARDPRRPTTRTRAALEREVLDRLALGRGVAANSELRAAVAGPRRGRAWIPPAELCTDNAAMIAAAARFLEPVEYPDYLSLDVVPPALQWSSIRSPSTSMSRSTCA